MLHAASCSNLQLTTCCICLKGLLLRSFESRQHQE